MKILIAYVSKSGTTAERAELLRRQFPGSDVTLSDLAAELPDVTAYDAVIVGSYIRFGKTDRRFREFLARNEGALTEKPLGLFLCCWEIQNLEDYVADCLPKDLAGHAFDVECFGGSLDIRRFHGFERIAVHFMRSSILNSSEHDEGQYEKTLPAILPDNISRMATHLRAAVCRKRETDI